MTTSTSAPERNDDAAPSIDEIKSQLAADSSKFHQLKVHL